MAAHLARLIFVAALTALSGSQSGAEATGSAKLCDVMASKVRAATDVSAGTRTVWSLMTSGRAPFIEAASVSEVSLGPSPEPEVRWEFEKRFRSRYGNAESVLKDLRNWDNFDILGLRGSQVRMLLSTGGTAQCESRYFFRATTSREAIRVPDPPQKSPSDIENAICNNLGGWGYFARVGAAEAFVEYHAAVGQESLRIVPLADDNWQPACTLTAQFLTSSASAMRGRLEHLDVIVTK